MLTTFARTLPPEPRSQLHDGVTEYYTYTPKRRERPGRPTEAPPAPTPSPVTPVSASDFALQTLAFPADLKQQEILANEGRRVIICCTRQWGKSTTAAVKALHHALHNPASLVLIASRTRRQAGELLGKVIDFAKLLDIPIRRAQRHPDSLLLPNHTRIIALPGSPDSLRGFSAVSLLIVDLCEVCSNVEWPLESPVIIEVPRASTPH